MWNNCHDFVVDTIFRIPFLVNYWSYCFLSMVQISVSLYFHPAAILNTTLSTCFCNSSIPPIWFKFNTVSAIYIRISTNQISLFYVKPLQVFVATRNCVLCTFHGILNHFKQRFLLAVENNTRTESSAHTFPIRNELNMYLFRTQSGIFKHTSIEILVVILPVSKTLFKTNVHSCLLLSDIYVHVIGNWMSVRNIQNRSTLDFFFKFSTQYFIICATCLTY